ncbi:13684_t:CDS:2 [Funneliformis geosporum]|uniref:2476_t:CDS:1 n=1 Tax=Funneliformis geosporum TaxID=1117311 RepID=A0A9W4WNZ6_9GLOM|nr:2476_t:CDS:2 [Funneliformis geosporum]CAI2168155.1 13684_t:CDS:2 [Funneliformis geosporum]
MSNRKLSSKSTRHTKEVDEWSIRELCKFLESRNIRYEDLKIIINEEIRRGKIPFTGEISLLVDHSNLLEQGKEIVKRYENVVEKPNLYVDYEQLRKTIIKGRKSGGSAEIFCSQHSQKQYDKRLDRLWNKRRDQGFVVNLIKQNPNSTREKKVDTTLVMHGMKILKERDPGILVIVAGDSDYVPLVEHALEKGWKVEIWFWSSGLSREYKPEFSKFGKNYSLHFLDEKYKKFTYARGPESPREFTFKIKHECVEILEEEPLLQLFVKWDVFGWWHWINNDHLLVYVNTEKQKEELARLFKLIEEYKNLNS